MGLSNQIPSSRIAQAGVCTSTTRPTSPYEGQVIYETDTNRVLVWDASAWVMIADTDQPPGLQLVKTQTIGSGVASVTVSDAFSSEWDAYKITVAGGAASGTTYVNFRVGTSGGVDAGSVYQQSFLYTTLTNTAAGLGNTSGDFKYAGTADSTGISVNLEAVSPYLATRTFLSAIAAAQGSFAGHSTGLVNTTTQYTHFTLYPNSGTFTGGTIRVYGFRNS